jgi:hypothetical protein
VAQILEPEMLKVRDLPPVLVEARLQSQDLGPRGDDQGSVLEPRIVVATLRGAGDVLYCGFAIDPSDHPLVGAHLVQKTRGCPAGNLLDGPAHVRSDELGLLGRKIDELKGRRLSEDESRHTWGSGKAK